MATTSYNIPILSIPIYYALAIIPHGIALTRVSGRGGLKAHDNRNPKSAAYAENAKKRLPPREFAAWERAESCHRNHLENMPLYVAAVFAGLLAEQRAGEGELGLITFVVGWMLIRVAYTANYLYTETQTWSFLRTMLYFWGSGWAFVILARAAFVLGN